MIRRKKTAVFIVILFILTTIVAGIIGNADINKTNQENYQPSLFNAEITFIIQTGEGCGCIPIQGVSVRAYGGDGNDSGITDEDGKCILSLVINSEYEVYIEGEGYHNIDFEFNVLDDQTFVFHLFEKKGSSVTVNLLSYQIIKHFLKTLLI